MEDPRLRAEFHRAFDAVVPPAPWLSVSVRERFRMQRQEVRPRPAFATAWLVPAVAVVLAVAIVAALLYVARSIPQRNIPVHPPRVGQGALGCPPWSTGSSGGYGYGQDSGKMTSATAGWYGGALRTVDGGAHWRDVSPPAMRADSPSDAGPRPYPPSYADFFLDSNHAWVARTHSSATSCFDHVTVFSTLDGGRTWGESDLVVDGVQADTSMQLLLNFIDPLHGWLMVLAGGRLAPDWFVYSTSDGGHNWKLVSQLSMMSSFCLVTFISQTTGYLGGCSSTGGQTASLRVTRDGGKTWSSVRLPQPFGTSFRVLAPVFFDQNRGIVSVKADSYSGNALNAGDYLAATEDGGKTWQLLPDLPPGRSTAFGFLDADHFWELTSEGKYPNQALYQSNDGGMSWTLLTGEITGYFRNPQVIFIDQRTGFIFDSNPTGQGTLTLLVTIDGGRTWKDVHPQIS